MTEKLHLHGEGVTKLSLSDDVLTLGLERYIEKTNGYEACSISFFGARNLKIGHNVASSIQQPTDEGEILRFKDENGRANLLIEWLDRRNNKAKITKLYEFEFDRFEIES